MRITNNGQIKNSCSRRVYKPVPAFCDSDLSASLLSAQLSQFESYQYYIVNDGNSDDHIKLGIVGSRGPAGSVFCLFLHQRFQSVSCSKLFDK